MKNLIEGAYNVLFKIKALKCRHFDITGVDASDAEVLQDVYILKRNWRSSGLGNFKGVIFFKLADSCYKCGYCCTYKNSEPHLVIKPDKITQTAYEKEVRKLERLVKN